MPPASHTNAHSTRAELLDDGAPRAGGLIATKALTMAFKLLEMAQQRWRRLDGAHLLPLVRAGVKFVDGVHVERHNDEKDRKEAA